MADPMPELELATFSPTDGVQLRFARSRPDAARGVALVLHGRTGFIEKYAETIAELNALGLAVWSFDWRGQGASTRLLDNPHKGHIDDFDTFLADLAAFVDRVLVPEAAAIAGPRVLVAHSMGAHLALRHVHDRPGDFALAALTSPMVRIRGPVPPRVQRGVAALGERFGRADRYASGGDWGPRNQRFLGNKRTHDRARFEQVMAAVRANPELALGGPTLGWLAAAHRSIAVLCGSGYVEAIATPVLAVAAGADAVVDTRATARLVSRLPWGRMVVVPGAKHEILHEQDALRGPFWRHFEEMLAAVAGARSTGRHAPALES